MTSPPGSDLARCRPPWLVGWQEAVGAEAEGEAGGTGGTGGGNDSRSYSSAVIVRIGLVRQL